MGYLLQFYIDPKSGYVFRSKKDVLRYLETGEISRHAFKPKEGVDNDQESINHKIISVSPLVRFMWECCNDITCCNQFGFKFCPPHFTL